MIGVSKMTDWLKYNLGLLLQGWYWFYASELRLVFVKIFVFVVNISILNLNILTNVASYLSLSFQVLPQQIIFLPLTECKKFIYDLVKIQEGKYLQNHKKWNRMSMLSQSPWQKFEYLESREWVNYTWLLCKNCWQYWKITLLAV